MSHKKLIKCLCGLTAVLLFTACSGGGSDGGVASTSTSTTTNTSGVKQGVAVDPYIVGAVFQEVAADGTTVLQRQSSASDDKGVFTFPQPLTVGSTVEMKISNKGLHGGAPFQGMLSRHIEDNDAISVAVTPLTTMLAKGVTAEDALLALNNAGFTGLTTNDLYGNPMSGLQNRTSGVTDQELELLQAAMAVEAFMEATNNFQPSLTDLTDLSDAQILNDMAIAVRTELNSSEFTRVRSALANDPQVTGQVSLDDLILAVVKQQQTLVAQVRQHMASTGSYDPNMVDQAVQNDLIQAAAMVKEQFLSRVPQSTSADGATLYADNCAGCHNSLANSTKQNRSATQIQTAINNNTGGMSSLSTLTTAEVQAIADALVTDITPPPPAPADGPSLYADNCAGCHGALATTSKSGRTVADIQAAIDNNIGGMGSLNSLTSAEVQAIANALPSPPPPDPSTPPDGVALYNSECAGCHGPLATTGKSGRTAAQIQAAINNNTGGMGRLSTLNSAEIQAIANALPAPPPPPATPDGPTLYADNCAGCHGSLANSSKAGRTAAQIQAAINNNTGGMGYLSTLNSAEVQAIAAALPAPPPPPVTPDGPALYAGNCAGCHGSLANSSKAGRTAAQIQAAINNNTGGMGYLSTLTSAEVQAIAAALPAPPPPPATPDGPALYAGNCAGCHGSLANSSKAGRTAAQIQAAINNNTGGMGYLSTLTSAEVQAIAAALPAGTPGPDYGDCTACHGQPPAGNSYPNVAGAHAFHNSLASVNNNCATCHIGAAHNGTVDLEITATFDAKSGAATANSNNTCSSVSCHGGQTTPNWQTGTIAVDTQCTSCHSSGTNQYNGYYTGQHSRHINKGYSCTVCHNTTKLATGHFNNLATSSFETDPAATIGGGSTRVNSYTPSSSKPTSGSCMPSCHGSENW